MANIARFSLRLASFGMMIFSMLYSFREEYAHSAACGAAAVYCLLVAMDNEEDERG